jgi:predicted transcriptional regulator of viral defense system
MAFVPTFCVDFEVAKTHNAGMNPDCADNSSQRPAGAEPIEKLRTAKLGTFFRPGQMEAAGLTRHQLRALVRSGNVERLGRGLYRTADSEPTEHFSLAMACARVPRSVVCLVSALRVHGIGTQAPAEVWIAIPHKARVPRLPELRLRVVRFSGPAWTVGVKEVDFEGVPGHLTSPARTVVDCFRFERLIGPEVAVEALQDALRQRKVTIADLTRVEEILPSRRLRSILDARVL